MSRLPWGYLAGSLLIALVVIGRIDAQPAKPTIKRALPPRWGDDVKNLFPEDAAKGLSGSRPNFAGGTATAPSTANNVDAGTPGTNPTVSTPVAGVSAWSKIIDADTVLAEIKSYQTSVADDVKSVSEFNGGGYKRSRVSYSMVALMFAVIAEYDGEIRFKKDALTARESFGRVGMNLKVSTQQTFNECKQRSDDLANLIRGESPPEIPGLEVKTKWNEKVSARPPLMTRLNTATEERLNKVMSDAGAFGKGLDVALHEAQVIAAISAAIQREAYEHHDDETYLGWAREMQAAATEIAVAAQNKNYDAARKAFGVIKQKCDDCHGAYR